MITFSDILACGKLDFPKGLFNLSEEFMLKNNGQVRADAYSAVFFSVLLP